VENTIITPGEKTRKYLLQDTNKKVLPDTDRNNTQPVKTLSSLSQKRKCCCYPNQPSIHNTQQLRQRSTSIQLPLPPLYCNNLIEYSEIFDSTKGYPGEGPPNRKQNNNTKTGHTDRTEGKLFDSTKGYPGEGPEIRRGKKRDNSTARGDQLWNKTLTMWHEQETSTIKAMGEHITIGHDLWYKKHLPQSGQKYKET
jgi:hypothetical protein